MKTIIRNGIVINEGEKSRKDIVIENDIISGVFPLGTAPRGDYDKEVDATGCVVFPGIIDSHVHFREPGMTKKADIESESRAAAYGGVTTYFDMPNTVPQTATLDTLREKQLLAREKSHVNYAFFYGATNSNVETFKELDRHTVPGIKLFMGSSTGNMLVDDNDSLSKTFVMAKTLQLPIMAHCEDTKIINENMKKAKELYGEDPDVCHHPEIRSAEACFRSSEKAAHLAKETGAHLHIAHITTADELTLLTEENITAEATVAHLLFSSDDYRQKGTRIKCNPSVKGSEHREALRKAVADGRIATIGTDHAPHCLSEKEGGAAKAVSGMPMLQFSLVAMLTLSDEGVLTQERIAELMCHNPARIFSVSKRGFIREGYKADLAIVRHTKAWEVTEDVIQSKCRWSPLEGNHFTWHVVHTFCNGNHILNEGVFDAESRGEQVLFRCEKV